MKEKKFLLTHGVEGYSLWFLDPGALSLWLGSLP